MALSHHAAEFSDRHTDYAVTASPDSTSGFDADIDAQGQFRIDGVPEAPSVPCAKYLY